MAEEQPHVTRWDAAIIGPHLLSVMEEAWQVNWQGTTPHERLHGEYQLVGDMITAAAQDGMDISDMSVGDLLAAYDLFATEVTL